MIKRGVIFLILSILVFLLPWWLTTIMILSVSFYYKNFYEAVFVGFLMDSFFVTNIFFDNFYYPMTLILFVLIFVINKIRQKLIMY